MSTWSSVVKFLFGARKPQATSAALMVNACEPLRAAAAKSTLALALERAEAPEQADVSAPKKAAKKRAPRKRKAPTAAAPPGEEAPSPEPAPRERARVRARAPAKGQGANGQADVWVSDAVAWSLSGRWSLEDEMWTPPPGAEAPKRLEEFREKAAEGKLIIWGRAGEVGSWEPIEAAYWRSCGIEQFSFLEGREKVFTEPKTAKPKTAAKYTALKVSRAQVEQVWQPATMH